MSNRLCTHFSINIFQTCSEVERILQCTHHLESAVHVVPYLPFFTYRVFLSIPSMNPSYFWCISTWMLDLSVLLPKYLHMHLIIFLFLLHHIETAYKWLISSTTCGSMDSSALLCWHNVRFILAHISWSFKFRNFWRPGEKLGGKDLCTFCLYIPIPSPYFQEMTLWQLV